MSASASRSDSPAQPGATAAVLRAAADFIESAGLHSGLYVICGNSEVRISVREPYQDLGARVAIVAKLAGLIGGTIRRYDNPNHPISDLRADGVIGGLHAAVKSMLPIRRTSSLTGGSRPLAKSPDGRITAVPGDKLPEGWRWVTELDVRLKHPAPWKPPMTAAATQVSGEAPQLAACDRPPW